MKGLAQKDIANLKVAHRDFKYYIFDWDDNILHMPTRIHLERRCDDGSWRPCQVSTAMFAVVRHDSKHYRPPGGKWQNAFTEFSDIVDREKGGFLKDTLSALAPIIDGREQPGPSFNEFRRALVEGRLFAIVTARGHSSATLRQGVRCFIDTVLSAAERGMMIENLRGYWACFEENHSSFSDEEMIEKYLDLNRFHAVTSPEFVDRMKTGSAGPQRAEQAKQFAIRDFVEHIAAIIRNKGIERPVSIGFSDDDPENVRAAENYIRAELARLYPGIKFVVYNTSDIEDNSGRKVVVQGQLSLNLSED